MKQLLLGILLGYTVALPLVLLVPGLSDYAILVGMACGCAGVLVMGRILDP